MRYKILTVDDSKAVRMIVKKAFKDFDCEILEAANGVEGLAMASKESPDIILLDVTMPIMDGVEMLTKLKADTILRPIPVVMLTAEAGRESVMKIAKLGIRDYMVKPFKEDVLLEKVGRIIDLRPIAEGGQKKKRFSDPCDILVVEDKQAIVQQIQEGLKHTPWKVHGALSAGACIDACQGTVPDAIIISLSLPEEGAFTLFRILRANVKTKYCPIFGMTVKTSLPEQQQAQQLGFTNIVTKPIDFVELESKVGKAMNLDTSERYFRIDEQFLMVTTPHALNGYVLDELGAYLKPKITEAVDAGINNIVFDVRNLQELNMGIIKLLFTGMQICQQLTLQYAMAGNNLVARECKSFEESKDWIFHDTPEAAKEALLKSLAAR